MIENDRKTIERGLSFEAFKDLSCGKIAKFSKDLQSNSSERFNQFINHTQQKAAVVLSPRGRVLSSSPAECGELRTASKIQNYQQPIYHQAQELIDGRFF